MLKPIATDTYSFERLITEGLVYVDKTADLYKLLDKRNGFEFFLSRPRRFGKSLMLSTLEAVFKGRRELFKGLAIDKLDYDWKNYPVIHLDMSQVSAPTVDLMNANLMNQLARVASSLLVTVKCSPTPSAYLTNLLDAVKEASNGKQSVILVDEYDSPLAGLLGTKDLLHKTRDALHDFYVVLKGRDADIRFLMMTGVSKFSKLSVFSGLNNLKDKSMDTLFATMLGYTKAEIETYFRDHVQAFADKLGVSFEKMVAKLRERYNGYRFAPEGTETVFNPVSVGTALETRILGNYWEETGKATIVLERIASKGCLPKDLDGIMVRKGDLDVCDMDTIPMESLLYQGGYLTIKGVPGPLVGNYALRLGIPNEEIRESLTDGYITELFHVKVDSFNPLLAKARRELLEGDIENFIGETLFSAFAMLPHEWKISTESEAKRYFLLFTRMAGADPVPEIQSARGRADAIIRTEKAIYLFEFKYARSAKTALMQIIKKGYADPYKASGKEVVPVGVNFNPETRNVDMPAIGKA